VCLGEALAAFAMGYAAEVKFLPEAIPDEITTPEQAWAWVKTPGIARPYQNPSPAVDAAPTPSSIGAEASGKVAHPVEVPPEAATPPLAPDAPPLGEGPPESDAEPPQGWEAQYHGEPLETHSDRSDGPGWLPPVAADMGAPADLWGNETELPVMPPECYPEAIRAYIEDEAEVMGCDPGMLALYCIAICAGCVTDEIRVQVKAASDRWQEAPRVWAMIVGDSGLTMKSPTLDAAISHAWKIERELRVKGGEAMKEYAREMQIYAAQEAEYVKKRAKGEPAEVPAEPPLPIAERMIVGNATLEAISEVLLQQGERGVLVRADELLGIIAGMNQYKGGKGSDRQDWLEMWNGGPHPIDRKGRAVLVKNWAVSIVGGTQPEAIARVSANLEADGLLQRFSIYLPRHSTRGQDREGDPAARRRYHAILDRLAKLSAQPDLAPVRFTPGASAIITDAREWIWQTAKASWLSAGLRSHLAKWPAMLARYCLTYAAIEAADEQQAAIQPYVSEAIARQVWAMMRGTLWHHAEHFYLNTLLGSKAEVSGARQIAGLILATNASEIDTRTMTQRSSAYRAAHPLLRRDIIGQLCELGWITPHGGKSMVTGLPTKYKVNERAHALFPHIAELEREVRAERTKSWDAAKAQRREPGED
jgi:hypothetical protein